MRHRARSSQRAVSLAELDVYHNLLKSVAEEMGVALMRTSFSPNIKERRDYSCAVFDGRGRMVVQGEHLPVHLGSMPMSVQAILGALELRRGDTAVVNDPFHGGTHLPDITFVTPVFERSSRRPLFFVANRAHHADVGGMSPGSMPVSREIFQEGLVIPPILLVRNGKIETGVMDLLLANVRTPEERAGDLLAQLAANQLGRRRVSEMLAKLGRRTLASASRSLQEYGERAMRVFLKSLPAGKYRFVDFLDDDGVEPQPLRIECALSIRSGNATVDFAGTSPQAAGCVNAPFAVTVSAVTYVFRTLLSGDVPSNYGSMLPIRVHVPRGTILNAVRPAAVAAGNVETSQRVVDVLYGALSKVPGLEVPAASSGTMSNISMGGTNPRSGHHFTYYETIAGGMGARPRCDGMSAVHTHMTNTMNTPIEVIEKEYPIRVRGYSIRKKSGGRGFRRGGDGVTRELELQGDAEVCILSDRRRFAPYGLRGGARGKTGRNTLIRGSKEISLPSKVCVYGRTGDRIRVETPGGGGLGRPKHRMREKS